MYKGDKSDETTWKGLLFRWFCAIGNEIGVHRRGGMRKSEGIFGPSRGCLTCIVRICMFWDAAHVLWGLRCSGIFGITTGAICLSCFHLISHRSRSTSEPWYTDSFPSRKIRCQPLPEPQCAVVRLRDGESRYANPAAFSENIAGGDLAKV